MRSAFFLFRTSIRGADILVAGVFVAFVGLGAFLLARAQAAAHLSFSQRAQLLQAALTKRSQTPQEDLTTLASVFEASGRMTRRQIHLLTDPMLVRHRLVYAFEWLPFVRDPERILRGGGERRGPDGYRFWEIGPGRKVASPAAAGTSTFRFTTWSRRTCSRSDSTSPRSAPMVHGEKARDSAQLTRRRRSGSSRRRGGRTAAGRRVYLPVYKEGDPGSRDPRPLRSPASRWRSSGSRRSWGPPPPPWTPVASAWSLGKPRLRGAPVLAQRPGRGAGCPPGPISTWGTR